ncbi:MAG: hypothetical protein JW850_00970 [Thermoflexales bacterium]|nr:hypothetical protein [Thermoflexales bacterium]
MLDGFLAWINAQPFAGLLLMLAAGGILAAELGAGTPRAGLWPWLRQILAASARSGLLLGLAWAFQTVLTRDIQAMETSYNDVFAANYRDVKAVWGQSITQDELIVRPFVQVVRREELPREDPTQPPRYRTITERQPVTQNSIAAFRGQVNLALDEQIRRQTRLAVYTLQARYEYDVVNDSELETETEFYFPLPPAKLYEQLVVTVDGQDIQSRLRFVSDQLAWTEAFTPHQCSHVVVSYASRGMEAFYYRLPTPREINDFVLTLTVSSKAFYVMRDPQEGPWQSEYHDLGDEGAVLVEKLDRVMMAPHVGISFKNVAPSTWYWKGRYLLQRAPAGLLLLAAGLALTLLIGGGRLDWASYLRDLAFLCGAYCAQFLITACLGDYGPGLWGAFGLGAVLTVLAAFVTYRHTPSRLLCILICLLAGFFALAYPRPGLWEIKRRDTFDGIVQVGLIVYLFGLCLFTVLRKRGARPAPGR